MKNCPVCKGTGKYANPWSHERLDCVCLHRKPKRKPVSELVRALNVIFNEMDWHDGGPSNPQIAERLRQAGFNVRWDAKKGRFV